jgi:FMNH2-dependent dimethyl sulfone monooxygenase
MRYGYWLPVFGGWLRNVEQENMEASWRYVKQLAQRSEQLGFDLTLVAELNLNDIKGMEAPSLDAWSTAAALAAVTEKLELMVAVRPTFHLPALLAKQAANIDHISNGRLSLNVVSSWWADEARKYGVSMESGRKTIFPFRGNITGWRITFFSRSPLRSRVPPSMPVVNRPRPKT